MMTDADRINELELEVEQWRGLTIAAWRAMRPTRHADGAYTVYGSILPSALAARFEEALDEEELMRGQRHLVVPPARSGPDPAA